MASTPSTAMRQAVRILLEGRDAELSVHDEALSSAMSTVFGTT
jgi:hypothetical protein